jgi:hypothetical protein
MKKQGEGLITMPLDETIELTHETQERLRRSTNTTPVLTAGDLDARWDEAESAGDETAGGSNATPDQTVVEEIGAAIGVTYEEGEELRAGIKEYDRDLHRWELDPASSEDYRERTARGTHKVR